MTQPAYSKPESGDSSSSLQSFSLESRLGEMVQEYGLGGPTGQVKGVFATEDLKGPLTRVKGKC